MDDRLTFAGVEYPTENRRNRVCVESYLWAFGDNSDSEVGDYLSDYGDVDIAQHILTDWPNESVSVNDLLPIIADIRAEMMEE